jgi:hypothetical protein
MAGLPLLRRTINALASGTAVLIRWQMIRS